jgi:VWFA-related protein
MLVRSALGVFWLCCALNGVLYGQGNSMAAAQGYTLRSEARSVLTDVTVTDRNGEPVRGLKASAFHILDENHPQEIASFDEHDEHTGGERSQFAPTLVSASGVSSNDFALHPPPVVNIVLLDTVNLNMPDQMYLRYQLDKFVKTLRPDEYVAIFAHNGPMVLQLQGFTADHGLVAAAIHKALPRFPPTGRQYYADSQTLIDLVEYLRQVPGRKNVLWFSGGSTRVLFDDGLGDPAVSALDPNMRLVYDALEASRIAVYPIDARGLTTTAHAAQLSSMREAAEATGGHAYYNTNGLAQVAAHVVETDGSFYTLTCAPHDFKYDGKWHNVRVLVDGNGYQLSYRRGYFADGSNGGQAPSGVRTRLEADGSKRGVPSDDRDRPLVFQARAVPGGDPAIRGVVNASSTPVKHKHGTTPVTIIYEVPADSLTRKRVDGQDKVLFETAVLAFSPDGYLMGRNTLLFTLGLNEAKLRLAPHTPVELRQEIDLHKGDAYLVLGVRDMTSGAGGVLELPVQVPARERIAP